MVLTHFQLMFHFYISWKHQKTGGFLMFLGGIEVEHWLKIGWLSIIEKCIIIFGQIYLNLNM